MALATRLTVAMIGLILLTATALALLAFRDAETPTQLAGLAAVAGVIVLAHALAKPLARTAEDLAAPGSERHGLEAALEQYAQRERTLSAAVELTRSPIITTALDGKITDWNPSAERLYGYTAAEAIGKSIEIIVPPDRRDEYLDVLNRVRNELPVETLETVRVGKDGRRIDVSVSVSAIRSAAGEIIGVSKITHDLTARKVAAEKFRLAVELCPSGMVMIDRIGKIVMVNTEVERLFGYRRDELMGRPVDMLVPERLRGHHMRHRHAFMREPEARRMGSGRELFGLRKDGTEFPVEIGLSSIHAREEQLVLSVIVDISERKRMERLKDDFVSTVSHELRTPLTSIAGSLGLLAGGAAGNLPDPATRLLTIAQTNSQRLVRLINDILDIEKMESGQIVFNFKRVEARSLVEQAMEGNRGFAEGYGVRLRLDTAAVAGIVRADPDRLSQVVTNLLSNAIKFSPKDAEVVVAVEHCGAGVRISVRDYGAGIPAEFKPHIFEKFAQADASNARQKGGTGLGLSIVKQIVTRLGGKVGFDDAPGGGSIFYVELPAWEQLAASEFDLNGTASGPRILLCEDDPDTAIGLREGLRQFEFRTDFAHTEDDAIVRAAATPYAAILVDHQFPDSGGIDLIRRLRKQPGLYRTPIVVLSAHAGPSHDDPRASHLNVLDWLAKPVDIDHLAQILDRAIVRNTHARPNILHVDDDHDALSVVAEALGAIAQVVSVDSVDDARRALAAHHFDLAVLDVMVGAVSGLDLLPDLRTSKGSAIPVIVFSAHGADMKADMKADMEHDPQVQANLGKSQASLDRLVAIVQDRLMLGPSHTSTEVV
jgi:PAS domain S-box-containing protein